jgi:3-oxo-5alpha-steroid 4-dehydrogenase
MTARLVGPVKARDVSAWAKQAHVVVVGYRVAGVSAALGGVKSQRDALVLEWTSG